MFAVTESSMFANIWKRIGPEILRGGDGRSWTAVNGMGSDASPTWILYTGKMGRTTLFAAMLRSNIQEHEEHSQIALRYLGGVATYREIAAEHCSNGIEQSVPLT